MARIAQEQLAYLNDLVGRDPREALSVLRAGEGNWSDDSDFRMQYGGMLIDIGDVLGMRDEVTRGIDILAEFLPTFEGRPDPNLLYNLANGYSVLETLARQDRRYTFNPDTTPLIIAKRYYRCALEDRSRLDFKTRSALRVNYGNCLSGLGRFVEAVDQYDLALRDKPDHAMARGNLGIELIRYANIAHDVSLLRNASEALRKVLEDGRIEETGSSNARPQFEDALHKVEEQLSTLEAVGDLKHRPSAESHTAYHRSYVDFCRTHHLFLNFCLRSRPCAHAIEDTIGLSLVVDIGDDTTYVRLNRIINEVKERYATARLLLFEACNPACSAMPYDELTHYTDNLDYSVIGVTAGRLKIAYEAAYNVLDKIALFVNGYLSLGIRERRVNFASILRERSAGPIRSDILGLKNWHLYALYDLSRDLTSDGYYSHLSKLRNVSTHRYLIPHFEDLSRKDAADGAEYHLGYHELLERTIDLMQIVRCAIIYLTAFITAEEQAKRQRLTGIVPSLRMFRSQPYPFGPQDSPL